jgi:hypothetical protein
MQTDKELESTAIIIKRKKKEVLNRKGGTDADYIKDLQTLIKLEDAVERERSNS